MHEVLSAFAFLVIGHSALGEEDDFLNRRALSLRHAFSLAGIRFPFLSFLGRDIKCSDDYTEFCDFWQSDILVNSLLAGASFLLLANFILIACAVANFMRYRYNIASDVIEVAKKEQATDGQGLREENAEQS
jgi:hypothetical protein